MFAFASSTYVSMYTAASKYSYNYTYINNYSDYVCDWPCNNQPCEHTLRLVVYLQLKVVAIYFSVNVRRLPIKFCISGINVVQVMQMNYKL